MPPKAEVFVIQDDPNRKEVILTALRDGSHTLFEDRGAETLADIDDMLTKARDRRPDACLVDKNFPYVAGQKAESLGRVAAQKITRKWPDNTPPIIAYTSDTPDYGNRHFEPATQSPLQELAAIIDSL